MNLRTRKHQIIKRMIARPVFYLVELDGGGVGYIQRGISMQALEELEASLIRKQKELDEILEEQEACQLFDAMNACPEFQLNKSLGNQIRKQTQDIIDQHKNKPPGEDE